MADKPNWTPGPWTADITDPSDVVVWASPDPKQNDELIANIGRRVQPVHVAFDCDAANAHLIAAAPDMAEALALVDAMAMWTESAADGEVVILTVGTVRKMRAAYAKARGQA
jgi:hypothetical protein